MPNNTEVEIIEKSGEWYRAKYNSQEGFLFAEFVQENEETTSTTDQEQNLEEEKNTVSVLSDINVYIIPQITSTVIATIPKDTRNYGRV